MFVRMARSPKLAAVALAAIVIAGSVLARTARAFNPQPDPPFGMVGIAEGQTARLNLVNLGAPAAIPPPCRARLRFLDADGNVVASRSVVVEAGQAAFLDFAPSFAPINTVGDVALPPRAEIRAVVNFGIDTVPPGPCRATVEIFDTATGRTSVFIPPGPCRGAACRVPQ
jgi:hypothetical protein